MPTRRLVLASASPARLRLLRDAGFAPEVVVSGVDEEAVEAESPGALVAALAAAKASVVAADQADAVVVGCDSLLVLDGRVLGKPKDSAEAAGRWAAMAGRSGELLTGHCVIDTAGGRRAGAVASTVVHFGRPTEAELAAYIASGEPLRVAGAFTIDGRGGPFVERIEGDHGTVVGLSLPLLRSLLGEVGVTLPELWQ